MHKVFNLSLIKRILAQFVMFGCIRDFAQGSDLFRGQTRNELGITKRLIVASVAKELSSIMQPLVHLLVIESGLRLELRVVTIAVLVQADDEVVERFRLGRDLSENHPGTSETGLGDVMRVELLNLAKCFKMRLDLQGDDRWRAVREVLLLLRWIHDDFDVVDTRVSGNVYGGV